MWACRAALMSRPRTLLNSIRRRVTEPPPAIALGSASSRGLVSDTSDSNRRDDDAKDKAADSSARRNGGEPGGTPATSLIIATAPADLRRHTARRSPPTATGQKKHLYLVLDDAKYGFGIHKLGMDSDADDDVAAAGGVESGALPRLPKPPVLRIEDKWIDAFAVLGSNVIGMASGIRDTYDDDRRSDGDTLTFDIRTAELALLPDLPNGLRNNCVALAVAAGDRLYVIEDGTAVYHGAYNRFWMGGLHCLKLKDDGDGDAYPKGEPRWSWYATNCHNYHSTRWFWSCDPHVMLPLSPEGITAHALHPAGRAFFVSVHCHRVVDDHRDRGTFSYDGAAGWTHHGAWELPFIGQAHYDEGLRAWVGIHAQRDGHGGFTPDGHICACDVPGLDDGPAAAPGWKLGKEKLFVEDPERHVDAKLVAMGGGGRFCLVEIVTMPGVDKEECVGDGDKCVLRLTAFRVVYDDDGELTTTDRRPARSFRMSKYRDYGCYDYWLAFWA